MFKVHIGYTRAARDKWRKFETLEAAQSFCNTVAARTGIILTIVKG